MSETAPPPETRFDVMADLCILAGQAVMQVGSNDLRAAMRVVLGILGREVAARLAEQADRPAEPAASGLPARGTKPSAKPSAKPRIPPRTKRRTAPEHSASYV